MEIQLHYLKNWVWKFEVSHIFDISRWPTSHFRTSNAIFEKMEPSFNLKSWFSTDFNVIWRWCKQKVCIFTQFPVKNVWNFEIRSRDILLVDIAQSHTVKSLAHLVFGLFGRDYDDFRECDVIIMGIPPKIGDSPWFHSDFVS